MGFNIKLAKVLIISGIFLSVASFIDHHSTEASSIPIWEFLTRNEKMSYLYSTFAQLVSVHCKATTATSNIPVNQCKRDLLNYAYEKLQTFTDLQLDSFDPYQRNANEMIWSSIMRDHPSNTLITTRKPTVAATPPATSIVILTPQKPDSSSSSVPNTGNTPTVSTDATSAESEYPKNPMFESSESDTKHQYAMDMDIAYGYPSMSQNPQIDVFDVAATSSGQHHSTSAENHNTYLTGPSVVRVKPDGSPVEEDKHKPLVKDDDLEHYMHASSAVPFGQLQPPAKESPEAGSNERVVTKHKIATINALKQQYLASLSRQEMLPPLADTRVRRHQPIAYYMRRV